jgi:catechol 2,3-dioxygenase-like lactoylglutathione lyase family enzyme
MPRIIHIHIKAPDPGKSAGWWVEAFAFTIVSDEVRPFGDRFFRCRTEDGFAVTISGPRPGETLGPGDASAHFGLEHVAFDTAAIETDIARLTKLGARLQDGPIQVPGGPRVAFLHGPDDVRIELVEPPK